MESAIDICRLLQPSMAAECLCACMPPSMLSSVQSSLQLCLNSFLSCCTHAHGACIPTLAATQVDELA